MPTPELAHPARRLWPQRSQRQPPIPSGMCTPQPGYVIDSNGRSVSDQNPGARLEGSSMLPGFEKQASGELALPETIMATNIQGPVEPSQRTRFAGGGGIHGLPRGPTHFTRTWVYTQVNLRKVGQQHWKLHVISYIDCRGNRSRNTYMKQKRETVTGAEQRAYAHAPRCLDHHRCK